MDEISMILILQKNFKIKQITETKSKKQKFKYVTKRENGNKIQDKTTLIWHSGVKLYDDVIWGEQLFGFCFRKKRSAI